MRIALPKSQHPVTRLNVDTPKGGFSISTAGSEPHAEFELPEGVCEDDVTISVDFLGNGRQIMSSTVLKEAVVKPVNPPAPETIETPVILPTIQVVEPTPEPTPEPIEENAGEPMNYPAPKFTPNRKSK